MAPQYPPFMFAYGILPDMFAKIQEHDSPEVFTHEFLRFKLGFSRESDRAFIPLAKRTGLLTNEGKPTELYQRLRDPAKAAAAVAEAMKLGFPTFYAKHAEAHELDRKELAALVTEGTELEQGHPTARAVVGTFLALKALANPPLDGAVTENRRKVPERRKRW
ncbi:MAG: DUF5343 domain-containing protein [Usitatibacteraceae bacterium]